MKTGDADLIKQINKHRILSALRPNQRLARIEIARATDLSPATVTALTQELMSEGLLIERDDETEEPQIRRRGRPKVALTLNPQAALVVGVKISMHKISVAVTDFVGAIRATDHRTVPVSQESSEHVADMIEGLIRDLFDKLEMPVQNISGIGVALPGIIDHLAGVCHWSPVFGARTIPFSAMMGERFGVPVFVDNDANLLTLAEQWFGHGRGMSDFVVVSVEHGVGMGLVVGGELYRGHRGFGSEFGHIKIQRNGAQCRCGQRGCVEAYVADYAILREAAAFLPVPGMSDAGAQRQAVTELAAKARAGDPQIAKLFERAGEALGVGVANLVNLFNPPLVVLSGSGIEDYDMMRDGFERALRENALSVEQTETPIRIGGWDDTVWARGGAAMVLQALYQAPLARPLSGGSA